MITVFVFHRAVGFKATAVIVRVYKKKNDLLTAWQTDKRTRAMHFGKAETCLVDA